MGKSINDAQHFLDIFYYCKRFVIVFPMGQRDRSFFLVLGQRDNGTSSKSCHGTGRRTEPSLFFCHILGLDVRQDNHYFSLQFSGLEHLFLFQNVLFLFQNVLSCFITSFGKGDCPGIFAPALVRDKGTFGQEKFFVPGQSLYFFFCFYSC